LVKYNHWFYLTRPFPQDHLATYFDWLYIFKISTRWKPAYGEKSKFTDICHSQPSIVTFLAICFAQTSFGFGVIPAL